MVPHYEDDLGKWAAPFVMAPINTKNVHRTNFLLGHPYGKDFRYDEMVLTRSGETGKEAAGDCGHDEESVRSEEHTSELQSLLRISYAVFCLKKQSKQTHHTSRD